MSCPRNSSEALSNYIGCSFGYYNCRSNSFLWLNMISFFSFLCNLTTTHYVRRTVCNFISHRFRRINIWTYALSDKVLLLKFEYTSYEYTDERFCNSFVRNRKKKFLSIQVRTTHEFDVCSNQIRFIFFKLKLNYIIRKNRNRSEDVFVFDLLVIKTRIDVI